VLQSGDSVLPVLAEAINALADQSTPFADKDALAGGIVLTAAFLSDPRGRDTLALHAEEHAGAIIGALCRMGSAGAGWRRLKPNSPPAVPMDVRETALDALVAATSLPFSAVYPQRKAVERASVAALDDPKRRVRFAAGRCREVWLALGTQT
jgi:DNA repair/transcription protein MET18/MMS19